jgi:predicted Rossmann fold nucleotide-binding protein DprA/Smf involved in DNA uptake
MDAEKVNEEYKIKEYEKMIEQQNKTIQTLRNKLKELRKKLERKPRSFICSECKEKKALLNNDIKKRQRKPHIEIKLKILDFLQELPMTQYELSKAVESDYKAVGQALIYLEKLGKVEKVKLNVYDSSTEEKKILWRLKKE